MVRWTRLVAVGLGLCVLSGTPAACIEHKVGDKTVRDAFPDPRIAELADAACRGRSAEVARLAAAGADANAKGRDGVTPLFWAISCRNVAGIEALLRAGADPNHDIPGHFTLVYQAASYSDSKIIRAILDGGGNPNIKNSSDGEDPMKEAVFLGVEGNWGVYYELIRHGYDINQSTSYGETLAIKLAAVAEWEKVLELLKMGYRHDLARLARYTTKYSIKSDQEKYKEDVRAWLRDGGIKLPEQL